MESVKTQALELISSLPDDCTLEQIQYHLYVCQKVERGLAAIENGDFISQEEAEAQVREWRKSSGPRRG